MDEEWTSLKTEILPQEPGQTPLPAPNGPRKGSVWGIAALLAVVVAAPVAALGFSVLCPLYLDQARTVIVPKGASVQNVADILSREGIFDTPYVFRLVAQVLAENKLRAGEYNIEGTQTIGDVVLMMRDGKSVVRRFTVPEGLTSHEIVKLLQDDPTLSGTIDKIPADGALLPETYHYSYGDERSGIVARMEKAQREALAVLWEQRDFDLPLRSPEEAVVMASLVEKETGKKAEERARVAGVFMNRLRAGMRLQSDPTVIYAITMGLDALGRSLTRADLAIESPYNTYTVVGLPPKPICNPGRAALEAAVKPEKNDYYYFVADGTGGHSFAKNLDAHNKNVREWVRGKAVGK